MTATHEAQREIIAEELRLAAERMSPNERALGDALLALAGQVQDAVEFLRLLTDQTANADHALVAGEVMKLLLEAGHQGVGAHAAVIKARNRCTVQ